MATLAIHSKHREQRTYTDNKHFVNEKSFVLIKYAMLIENISP